MSRHLAKPECRHVPSRPPSRTRRRATLDLAEARCLAAGERWTKPRQRTYELLVDAEGHAARAYDLIAAFAPGGVKPPTVYRALDFLIAHGFAHRVESLNAFIACTQVAPGHAPAFMICDCCGRADEVAVSELRSALDGSEGSASAPSCWNCAGDVRLAAIDLHDPARFRSVRALSRPSLWQRRRALASEENLPRDSLRRMGALVMSGARRSGVARVGRDSGRNSAISKRLDYRPAQSARGHA